MAVDVMIFFGTQTMKQYNNDWQVVGKRLVNIMVKFSPYEIDTNMLAKNTNFFGEKHLFLERQSSDKSIFVTLCQINIYRTRDLDEVMIMFIFCFCEVMAVMNWSNKFIHK